MRPPALTRWLRTDEHEILDREGLSDRGRRVLEDLDRWNRLTGWYKGHLRRIEAWHRALGAPRPFRVLDVGTGPGALLDHLARHMADLDVPVELVGVDLNPDYAAMAAERLGDRARIVVADATDLPFEAGSFHLGTTALMIHHLPRAVRGGVISELARVCQGAYVFDLELTLYGAVGWSALAPLMGMHADTRHDGVVSVRRGFTRPEFEALVAPLGARVRRVLPTAFCTVPPD